MNIVVFNGSPKGQQSNTLKLTKAFLDGFTQNVPADIDIVDIYRLNIRECKGCFACWNKTPGTCILHDDMQEILQKILQADVIIYSFPLYYFNLPSRMKMIFDRQLPLSLPFMENNAASGGHASRYDMSNKRYVAISTCGFYTAENNYDAVDAQLSKLYGQKEYTSIYCGQGELFRVPELQKRTDEYLDAVKTAGNEFSHGDITAKTQQNLSQLLFPRDVFEQMADASWGIDTSGATSKSNASALTFTKQMAALYNTKSWKDHDIVLEMDYTDVKQSYQIVLKHNGHDVLTDNFLPYTTKIETPLSVWTKIAQGELDGRDALMKHLYRVSGNFDFMIHWDDYFGMTHQSTSQAQPCAASHKKTNMTLMLLPWIALWIALPIDSFWGGIIGIVLCTALPFAHLHYKATVFEYITFLSGGLTGLFSVLGAPLNIVLPLSYLVFGIMWSITACMKIPLSAYYSMNDYGEEEALGNPLFIRTNRILTACWGILYLIMPVWTYILLQTSLASVVGIGNSVLPLFMGLFTLWFQKWYPKHYASQGI